MAGIESLIEGSRKLTDIFGDWPSFHDAEVLEIHLWRGDVNPEEERYIFPVVTARLHLWELTAEEDARGHLVRRLHTLATLRFHDVDELTLEGFNHQNAIFELSIEQRERTDGPSPHFAVDFVPAFGVGASFQCARVEVVDAVPCSEAGKAFA